MEPWTDHVLNSRFRRWYYSTYGNELEPIIEAFPDKGWDLNDLSRYLSLEFIEKHIRWHWGPTELSSREDITWEFVLKVHLWFHFDFTVLSSHPNITFKIIKENPAFSWAPCWVLQNPNVKQEDVNDNFFKCVSYKERYLSSNPNFPVEFLLNKFDPDWHALTRRASLSLIKKNPDKPWNLTALAARNDIPISEILDIISKHPTIDVGARRSICRNLAEHPQITLAVVDSFPGWSEIDWRYITRHVPFEEIIKNPDRKWVLTEVSVREEVTLRVIKENPKIKWQVDLAVLMGQLSWEEDSGASWKARTGSPFVTWETIKNNPGKPWDLSSFSLNPHLTVDIIKGNPGVGWMWKDITRTARLAAFADTRRLVKEERKKVADELEKIRILIPDINRIVADYLNFV